MGYDENGNVTSKTGPGGNYTYTWDGLGRLTEVRRSGAVVATYKYDALGRRVTGTAPDGTTERYVYDGDQVILDVNGSHAVKTEYGYAPGVDRLFAIKNTQTAAWTGVVLADPVVGTVQAIANLSGGALRKTYELTAWGQGPTDSGVVTRFRMAGREYDQATKLYYMRARYYDPDLGRFLSEDPVGIAGGLNLYVYAGNDPINLRDPFGLCTVGNQPKGDDISDLKKEDPGNKGENLVASPMASECAKDDDGGGGVSIPYVGGGTGGLAGTDGGGAGGYKPPVPPRPSARCLQVLACRWSEVPGLIPYLMCLGGLLCDPFGPNEPDPMSLMIANPIGMVAGGVENVATSHLVATHSVTRSSVRRLAGQIEADGGIRTPLNYVLHQGQRYVVDGNHRLAAARLLRMRTVPAQRVDLPFKGFKTAADLIFDWHH